MVQPRAGEAASAAAFARREETQKKSMVRAKPPEACPPGKQRPPETGTEAEKKMPVGSIAAEKRKLPGTVDAGDGLQRGHKKRRGRTGKRKQKPCAHPRPAVKNESRNKDRHRQHARRGHAPLHAVVEQPAPGMVSVRVDEPGSPDGVIPLPLHEDVQPGTALRQQHGRKKKQAERRLYGGRAKRERHAVFPFARSGSSMVTQSPPPSLLAAQMRP